MIFKCKIIKMKIVPKKSFLLLQSENNLGSSDGWLCWQGGSIKKRRRNHLLQAMSFKKRLGINKGVIWLFWLFRWWSTSLATPTSSRNLWRGRNQEEHLMRKQVLHVCLLQNKLFGLQHPTIKPHSSRTYATKWKTDHQSPPPCRGMLSVIPKTLFLQHCLLPIQSYLSLVLSYKSS